MKNLYNRLADLFNPILSLPYGDKILHFIAFGLIGIFALTPMGEEIFPRLSVVNIMMVSLFFGIAWELLWHVVGISVFSIKDLIADGLGGLFFGVLYYVVVGGIPMYVSL